MTPHHCTVCRRALPLVDAAGRCAGCSHAAVAVEATLREIRRDLTGLVLFGDDATAARGTRMLHILERRPEVRP